ncbi:MAG: bifunctional UDP-N-acetylglucosamine diphosphorylase/glucosamine-1-phosphate N-acetyltransferase GlmU [Sulfuricellaceae bacterium]|nr:bifunctional UDP-N-acetylglucosamine diphosphorylase/glucosamine-1-phosphate N-acetyltransferase GlmU [Sulfuricellaceae bacterium]
MTEALDVVILAAGKGTRMVSDRPKVLHKLAGKSMLQHVVDTASTLEPARICVIYGFGGEQVPSAIQDPEIKFVKQEPQLGTGHAVQQAIPYLDESHVALILYGDVPLIQHATLKALVALAKKGHVGLLTVELFEPQGYGRIVREGGEILRIVEHKDANQAELGIREVNTGIMAIPNRHLTKWLHSLTNQNAQGEYYLTDVIELAKNDGVKITACMPDNAWEVTGVNSRAQLEQLERQYQRERAQKLMDAGVSLNDASRFDVRGTLTCGNDVEIDINCLFEGTVTLGDAVQVGANCVLKDVTVASGTRIEAFTHIEQASVGRDCKIGPYARIRPGSVLSDEVHIGNFVELKNSQIGFNSKINHLSYIGDSTVGSKVNIGAGAITCNYDGANKFRTVIEDGAFIGSDTQLIAPVTVGKGATIGAGSTITKDAPGGELTLSRSKQVSIPGWKRPVKTPLDKTSKE